MIRCEARTARKRYRCDHSSPYSGCANSTIQMISPGDRYVAMAMSPDHDGLGNLGWWSQRVCVNCARDLPKASKALTEDERCLMRSR